MRTRERQPEAIGSASWSPEDFILRGSYCPRKEILKSLERVCARVGAQAGLIISADEGALLRSLCLQAPKQPGSTLDLVGVLRGSSDLNSATDFPRLALTRPSGRGEEAPFPRSAGRLLGALAELVESQGYEVLAAWLSATDRWVPAYVPEAAHGRISAAVIFLDPSPERVVERGGLRLIVDDEAIIEIAQRVNATAQADVRRDAAIMSRLDNELDPADYAESTVNLEQAADSLVRLAAEVSQSDVGACYVFDHGDQAMAPSALALPEALQEKGWSYPSRITEDSGGSLAFSSLSNRRPIQLPPGFPAEPDLTRTCDHRYDSAARSIELATPIVGPLASPKAPAVGVLTVARLGAAALPYGAYDLAVLRNIGLRLALIKATANTEAAARVFAQLSTRATARIRSEATAAGPLRSLRLDPATPNGSRAPLPDDLTMTLPAIQEGLETLGKITGSYSATFRAALPSRERTGPHGLTLRRVAAYPTHWLKGEGDTQAEEEGGINWRVALTGSPQYAPVVADDDAYLDRREQTRSELCVPVLVEGRVIGVVNLESASRSAYDALVTTAQAFAAHVGLAIADARIAISSVLHDYAIEIVRRGHELGGQECRELRKLADEAPSGEWRARILGFADDIEHKAKGLRAFDRSGASRGTGGTFPDLVTGQRDAIALDFADLEIDTGAEWRPYPRGAAELVRLALKDVLGNVKRHAYQGSAPAKLHVHQGRWGGELHDILTVVNRPASPLSEIDAVNAFRALLGRESPDGAAREGHTTLRIPQFGAYLAGSTVRRIGGDVHLCQRPDGLTQVTLSIPSSPRQHDWSGGT